MKTRDRVEEESFGNYGSMKSQEGTDDFQWKKTVCREKLYKCDLCCRVFTHASNLEVHLRLHIGDKPYSCETCGTNFLRSDYVRNHKCHHIYKHEFTCSKCGETFKRSDWLRYHEVNKHEKAIELSNMRRYKKQNVSDQTRTVLCDICGSSFNDARQLKIHLKKHLNSTKFTCQYCGQIFNQSSNLNVHLRKHTGMKPYKCTSCNEAFSTSSKLKTHARKHTGDLPFVCNICGRLFGERHLLKMHQLVHNDSKSYICTTCGKGFTHRSTLQAHIRTHTGEKPFKCNLCNQAFSQSSSLTYHRRSHSGEKPYSCHICGSSYTRSSSLHTHIAKHTEVKQLPCPQCNFILDNRNTLRDHLRTVHNLGKQVIDKYIIRHHSQKHSINVLYDQSFVHKKIVTSETSSESPKQRTVVPSNLTVLKDVNRINDATSSLQTTDQTQTTSKDIVSVCDAQDTVTSKISTPFSDLSVQPHSWKHLSVTSVNQTHQTRLMFIQNGNTDEENSVDGRFPQHESCSKSESDTSLKQLNDYILKSTKRDIDNSIHIDVSKIKCGEFGNVRKMNKALKTKVNEKLITIIFDKDTPACSISHNHANDTDTLTTPQESVTFSKKEIRNLTLGPLSRSRGAIFKKKPVKCPKCGKMFSRASNLTTHMRLHTGHRPFLCTHCHKTFIRSDHLKRHSIQHETQNKSLTCGHCGETSSLKTDKDLQDHIITAHGGVNPFLCGLCLFSSLFLTGLLEHVRSHQLSVDQSPLCSKCGKSMWIKDSHDIKTSHLGSSDQLVCEKCEKVIPCRSSLNCHDVTRHNLKAKPFKCGACTLSFASSAKLKNHMLKHTGSCPLCCEYCGKIFTSSTNLKRHLKIHNGEKPYKCHVCEKSFSHLSTLKSHVRTHTGNKPYVCKVCGKSFAQISSLNYHQRVHDGQKPYKCNECGKSYTRSASLKIHCRSHTIRITPSHRPTIRC